MAVALVAAPQSSFPQPTPQGSSPQTAPQNSPPQTTFTSNSELVIVPVQVMDHGGKPLPGLKKEDFVLQSDGQPQQIAVFDEVRRSTQVIIPSHKAKLPRRFPPVSPIFLPTIGYPAGS
jgi:hypothetical protein